MSKQDLTSENSDTVFDVPTSTSDVTLVVEDKELHVNKAILSQASPVFERMFNGEFKEKGSQKIPLPGKCYQDMKEMLSVIYPSIMKDITRENVDGLLALAEEYQIKALTERCERVLVPLCEKCDKNGIVHLMFLAGRFGLPTLLECSTTVAANIPYIDEKIVFNAGVLKTKDFGLIAVDEFRRLSLETENLYLRKRVQSLERERKK